MHYYYNPSAAGAAKPAQTIETDVCIYGGTSAGVAAAVQLSRMGKKAVILEPGGHLGGLSAGGLGQTDIGHKEAIGGISREFYGRVGKKYGMTAEEWRFEPHVASQVFGDLIAEAKVPVHYRQFLKSVEKQGNRITTLTTESGLTVRARVFIDATYEGDLMAQGKVGFHVGREANAVYKETLNGIQVHKTHQFNHPVDPYVVEGDPKSGLLPGITSGKIPGTGEGDNRVQAYNFRLALTNDPDNRIAFEKPEGYDPKEYVLLARYLKAGWPESEVFRKFDPIHNSASKEPGRYLKVDKNNHGATSTDFIGRNHDYPTADYATRERIFQEHVRYTQGLMWFMGNDPAVPPAIRTRWNTWGLCKDEFTETGGWPHQLYVREARRMVADYVMTERNCVGKEVIPDPVGLAAYQMDSHNCQRFVKDGHVSNEGDVQTGNVPPYPISFRSIVPKKAQCDNLLVPVCLSASHIAYGSIRMEPVFMILGQSAATAAAMAIDTKAAVQDIPYEKLKARLLEDKQILVGPKTVEKL
ncbi:MAG: FAD-dependent oxidoreductase [Armatimonadota bacterium]